MSGKSTAAASAADPLAEPKVDGRRERTKRTRAAIVGALVAILDEGRIEPTAAEIAARASVAVRSIGQHFASREALLLAVTEYHAARTARPSLALDPGSPLQERVDAFVARRAQVLEASRALRGAAAVVIAHSPSVAKALERIAAQRRTESASLFAAEIAEADDPEAVERAVALVTSGRAWDALRVELGLGVKAASRQMAFLLRNALSAR